MYTESQCKMKCSYIVGGSENKRLKNNVLYHFKGGFTGVIIFDLTLTFMYL